MKNKNLVIQSGRYYLLKVVANDSQKHEWAMIQVNGTWIHLSSGDLRATETYNRVTTPDTFNNAK